MTKNPGPNTGQDVVFPRKGIYRHYKGKEYRLENFALLEETLEWMVIYRPLYEQPLADLWIRPLAAWDEPVDWQGETVSRFTWVSD